MLETSAQEQNPVKETLNSVQRCQKCKYFTKSTDSMKSHLVRHDKLEEFNCGQNTLQAFFCEACDYATHLQICWKEHQETHRNEAKHNFELNTHVCKCSFQTFSSLVWLKHQPCRLPHLSCDHCNYKTRKEHSLKNHALNEHLPKRPSRGDLFYDCDKCRYGSYNLSSLEAHIRSTHRPEEFKKWFKCAQCDYKTKYTSRLKSHIWKHEKWCECDQCDYKSNNAALLRNHKVYKHCAFDQWLHCTQCEYKGKVSAQLKNHIYVNHTPEELTKWFQCDQCEFKSKRQRSLKLHKKYMHEEIVQWFSCEHCEFKAKRKMGLKRHLERKHLPK